MFQPLLEWLSADRNDNGGCGVCFPPGWNAKSRTVPPVSRVRRTITSALDSLENRLQKKVDKHSGVRKLNVPKVKWDGDALERCFAEWVQANAGVPREDDMIALLKCSDIEGFVRVPIDKYPVEGVML